MKKKNVNIYYKSDSKGNKSEYINNLEKNEKLSKNEAPFWGFPWWSSG